MGELLDIYDSNRKKIGKITERKGYEFEEGEYRLVVTGIILNQKNEMLISQRAENKKNGLKWECNGGSILSGETSLEGIIRELKEELGLEFTRKEAIYLKEIKNDEYPSDFKDIWLFRKDIKIDELKFQDGEVIDAKWVTIDEFMKMIEKNEINPTNDIGREEYEKALHTFQRKSYNYIGKYVEVKVDRPINSKHPKHGFLYEVNYGYVPNTKSGDGEELDAYILGIDYPIDKFEGECIGVIYRLNDDDDKLIIVPKGKNYTDEEIRKKTYFQEKYFESEIIR